MASGDDILNLMVQYLGTPYVWGGASPSGFDCSGLMQYVFGKAGVKIPRTAAEQAAGHGQQVAYKDARPGDLLYFRFDKSQPNRISHVAIYIGNGYMIEAPQPGQSVHVTKVYATPVEVNRYANAGLGQNVATSKYAGGAKYSPSSAFAPGVSVAGTAPDKLDINQLAENYGWDAAFLKSQPELAKLFQQAINDPTGQWIPAKFVAMLQQTQWWKTHSDTVRQSLLQASKDPATYAANVGQKQADLSALAASMGATIPPATLKILAERALTTGMDDAQIHKVFAGYINFSKTGTLGGDAGSVLDNMRQLAYQNGVKVSDQYLLASARAVEGGTSTQENESARLRELAASAFPQYAAQIKAGMNVSDIASPYVQAMGATLEKDPATIDLFDPTIRGALTGAIDPSTKLATAKPLWQFEQDLKSDPRWMQTNNARESMMQVAHGVLNDWGVVS